MTIPVHLLKSGLLFSSIVFLFACEWPYSPQQQLFPGGQGGSQSTGSGIIYSINTGQQTCNPSISQDMVNFPACMLWLGFSGILSVNVPASMPDYTTTGVLQHDRLTITDTSNTVRWYIMRDELSITGHIQDPEWSAHPNYLACLGEDASGNYDGYAIRISDKSFLKFCEDGMAVFSTPHFWLPDSIDTGSSTPAAPEYDPTTGLIKKEFVTQFFGTTEVKFVYALRKNGLTLYYIDYHDSIPTPVELLKPAGKENWDCESPLISPDGNWITYNCLADLFTNDIYIQRLKPGSIPVLVTEGAFEPHWWIDPTVADSYYIIYTQINGNKVITADLTDPAFERDGSAGVTMKQKLTGSPGDVPEHMGLRVDASSAPETIANLPFKGGLSRDGLFLCTGYIETYMLQLP